MSPSQLRSFFFTFMLAPLAVLSTALLPSLLVPFEASAALQIPPNLSPSDRETALRIVGLGTGSKILTDPYPLGGYSGFEAGLSVESLPTDDLSRLGSGLSTPQQDVVYPRLTFAKGIYNNIDLFLHFTPFRRQDEISLYGGMVRWGFFQGQYLPLSASLLLHANYGNFGNVLTTRTYGADLMTGITVNQVSLFAGLGFMQANGTYTGGTNGVAGAIEQRDVVNGLHTVVGANLRLLEHVFVALQLDRTEVSVLSAKLGLRF